MQLSQKERAVLEVLLSRPYGWDVAKIARAAGVARMTTFDILKRFEKSKIAERVLTIKGSKFVWKYRKGLEFVNKGWVGEHHFPHPIKK